MAETAPSLQVQTNGEVFLPRIAAIFFVKFDDRKGYTLTWHRSADHLPLEGVVEFKSLPSGLHNVKEDIVYFVHKDYAGVSAFVNQQDAEAERKARMGAVGVLIPLDQGRMGKAWRHALGLQALARKQVQDVTNFEAVEQYWTEHMTSSEHSQPEAEPSPIDLRIDSGSKQQDNGYAKPRSMSTGTMPLSAQHSLSAHHPASTLSGFLETFGPLVFPLYRAALLRKRVLLMGDAPVEKNCNYVYDLSILSSLSRTLASHVPSDNITPFHLRTLFNVGIQDIPLLSEGDASKSLSERGWVACTTDDVLRTKPGLFDLIVMLPDPDAKRAQQKQYPRLVPSTPDLTKIFPKSGLRATQRDSRRFRTLRTTLESLPSGSETTDDAAEDTENDKGANETASVLTHASVIEPSSWTKVAYRSLMWWASAGDTKTGMEEMDGQEHDFDVGLLQDETGEAQTKELAMVLYFHHMTAQIFSVINEAVRRTSDSATRNDDEVAVNDEEAIESSTETATATGENEDQQLLSHESEELEAVEITTTDMSSMGLDVWSTADCKFVEELIMMYWNRKADIRGGRIECCGIRLA